MGSSRRRTGRIVTQSRADARARGRAQGLGSLRAEMPRLFNVCETRQYRRPPRLLRVTRRRAVDAPIGGCVIRPGCDDRGLAGVVIAQVAGLHGQLQFEAPVRVDFVVAAWLQELGDVVASHGDSPFRHPPVPTSCGVDQVERKKGATPTKNFSESRRSVTRMVTFGGKPSR